MREHAKQHLFNGAWLPSNPPSLIGPENFSELRNLRYTDQSVQGVLGYSRLNETLLPDGFTRIRNGFQLRCPSGEEYTFVQAWNADLSASRLMMLKAKAPNKGEFEVTPMHVDPEGAGVARFAEVAGGQMVYCNGKETLIWAGEQFRCAGCFAVKDDTLADPKDHSEAMNNERNSPQDVMHLDGTYGRFLVLSTRPLQGVGIEIKTANATTSVLNVTYWNGTSWTDVAGLSDGTSEGGAALAKDGAVSWDSTVEAAKPKHVAGVYFYAYKVHLSAGTSTLKKITTNAPLQGLVDIWDGVYRTCTQFQSNRSSKYEDFTLEVNEESSVHYPICARVGGLTSSDHVILQFDERMSGVRIKMNADKRNEANVSLTVQYWDGGAWQAVTGLEDGTKEGDSTLGKTGTVSWNPPSPAGEHPRHLFGSKGYCYRIEFSATITDGTDHDGTSIDLVNGIPAQRSVPSYSFAQDYKGMLFLLDRADSNERNRVDHSMANAVDVMNGDKSSMLGEQSLYVGSAAPVVACTNIFNRFGSSVFDTLLILKASETHLLNGDSAEDFKLYTISRSVGCPAPLTLVSAEAGFELTEGVTRNVAMWLSNSGPYMFDGAVLYPLVGLEKYFDRTESTRVNFDAIGNARGWYDSLYKEYNLLLPTGSSTECDLWVVYDLVRKKWYRKDPVSTGALMPQCGFSVLDDTGSRHCYGGVDSGRLMRLEHGTSYDGAYILQVCETGDFWPNQDVYTETLIRHFKALAQRIDESHQLSIIHIPNTVNVGSNYFDAHEASSFTDLPTSYFSAVLGEQMKVELGLDGSAGSLVEANSNLNLKARSHRWRFEVRTKNTAQGFRPLMFGYLYRDVRISK